MSKKSSIASAALAAIASATIAMARPGDKVPTAFATRRLAEGACGAACDGRTDSRGACCAPDQAGRAPSAAK